MVPLVYLVVEEISSQGRAREIKKERNRPISSAAVHSLRSFGRELGGRPPGARFKLRFERRPRGRSERQPVGQRGFAFRTFWESIHIRDTLAACLPSKFRLCSELRCARVASVLWPHASSSSRAAIGGRPVGRSAIERAKWRLLRRPRLRHCIGGDGGGTWPLAPPARPRPHLIDRSGQRGPLPH